MSDLATRTVYGLAIALVAVFCGPALAQEWKPTKPVRLVAPIASGGTADFVARAVAQKLSAHLGQPVVVENRPGANGNVAAPLVAGAPPDGHTLLLVTTGLLAINPAIYPDLTYDPKGFTLIGKIADAPLVLIANKSLKADNVRELVALAKEKPGSVLYASAGAGSFAHLVSEIFRSRTGIDIKHVPYAGEAAGLLDTTGGRVQIFFVTQGSGVPQVTAGTVKALGVVSARRIAALPDTATLIEQGLADFDMSFWYGLVGPKDMPPAIVQSINAALVEALKMNDVLEGFAKQSVIATPSTPAEFSRLVERSRVEYQKIVQDAQIKMDK